MEKRTVRITVDMDLEINGNNPGEEYWCAATERALNDSMPGLIVDDEEEDCQIWLRSWEIVKAEAI